MFGVGIGAGALRAKSASSWRPGSRGWLISDVLRQGLDQWVRLACLGALDNPIPLGWEEKRLGRASLRSPSRRISGR